LKPALELPALGPEVLRQLQDVLTWSLADLNALLRSLGGLPGTEPVAQLIVIGGTDKVARLRLLRGIRGRRKGT
jgi:hypothetical protein